MSILSFLSAASSPSSSKEDLCKLLDGAPEGATLQSYAEAETIVYSCSVPRSDAWNHASGLVVQASLKSEDDMKKWHDTSRVTESARQGAADIAQARACVESSKATSDWAKAQVKLLNQECAELGQQADEDLAAMQALLADW